MPHQTIVETAKQALSEIAHPYLGRDVMALDMVRNINFSDGIAHLTLELSSPACPARDTLTGSIKQCLSQLPDIAEVQLEVTARVRSNQAEPTLQAAPGGGFHVHRAGQPAAPPQGRPQMHLPGVKNIVAVASGKGGVGKSTAAVNLATALAMSGAATGLIDADIHGPSVAHMLGVSGQPEMAGNMIRPLVGPAGLKMISMGLLTGDDAPAILRGPMVTKFLTQFIFNVAWGELDYLLLDLPPGTGDVHLTLVQTAPLTGGVIITTPQDVALTIARKGLRMFEKVGVNILGIIENMSHFECSHCHEQTAIFSSGGGRRSSHELGVPFLGEIPIDPRVVVDGDSGKPTVLGQPDSPAGRAYHDIAGQLAAQLAIMALGAKPFSQFHWNWGANSGAPRWDPAPTTNGGEPTIPAGIRKVDDHTLTILWRDGVQHDIPLRGFRLDCHCAHCIEEMTGQRLLDPTTISGTIQVDTLSSIGVYAINPVWEDGHRGGIHSYESLRQLGERLAGG